MVRFLETPVCQGQREHHADGRRWQGAARYRLNAARLANCGARSAVAHFQWAQVRQVESDTPGCLIALSSAPNNMPAIQNANKTAKRARSVRLTICRAIVGR